MSDGHHITCSSCSFEFQSGHSHHESSSGVVCVQCAAEFVLPTWSMWGPSPGEVIELQRVVRTPVRRKARRKLGDFRTTTEPTGQHVMAERPADHSVGFMYLSELPCSSCGASHSYRLDFSNGEACPQCKTGKLQCLPVEY